MTPSSDLFDLIKSLTKAEKRHFKLSASIYGQDKIYIKLFDAIEKQTRAGNGQEMYQEEKIKIVFKQESFVQDLAVWKNYLYREIIKNLNAYHTNDSVDAKLHEFLRSAQNLFDKGLYKQADKILLKADVIAAKHENFSLQLEIKKLERAVLFAMGLDKKKHTTLIENLEKESLIIEKQKNVNQYESLYNRISFLNNQFGSIKSNKLMDTKITQDPLFRNEKNALSIQAYKWYLDCNFLYSTVSRNNKNAFIYMNRVLKVYEKNAEMIAESPKKYIQQIINLLTLQSSILKSYKAEATFDKLLSFIEKHNLRIANEYIINRIFFSYASLTNLYLIKIDFGRGIKFISQHQSNIEMYFKKSLYNYSSHRTLLCYNIAYCYFGIGNYHATLTWINKVLNDSTKNYRYDTQAYLRVLHFMTHYELGNIEILESLAKSTDGYINKKINFLQAEGAIVNFISKKLIAITDKKEYVKALKIFKMELVSKYNVNTKNQAKDMFDIVSWVDSKIENRSYSEALKRNSH